MPTTTERTAAALATIADPAADPEDVRDAARWLSPPCQDVSAARPRADLPTVPETGGTPWPAPHHHAPGFLASCLPCIRNEPHPD